MESQKRLQVRLFKPFQTWQRRQRSLQSIVIKLQSWLENRSYLSERLVKHKTFLKAEEYTMFDSPAANVSMLAASAKEVKISMEVVTKVWHCLGWR